MANDVWNIKTDLRIQYGKTVSGTLTWYDIVADSYEENIDRGINVEEQVFARPDIGVATVNLDKSSLSDFTQGTDYKSNMPFRIAYRPKPDTASSVWYTIFYGFIQNVSMNYNVDSHKLRISITANDTTKIMLNARLSTFDITGNSTQRSFRPVMNDLATAIAAVDNRVSLNQSSSAGLKGGSTIQWANSWIDTQAGEILNMLLDAELGWSYAQRSGANQFWLTRLDIDALQATAWSSSNPTVSNIHSNSVLHYCMNAIDLSYDSDQLVNSAKVTEVVSTPASDKTKKNTTSISTYGEHTNNYEITMDVGASPYTAMSNWAQAVVDAADPKQIKSVECPAIRRDGTVSEVADTEIAETLQVEFSDGTNTFQQVLLVKRIRHHISVDHWSVGIELWKGI